MPTHTYQVHDEKEALHLFLEEPQRDILQTVQQKHNEEIQNSPSPASEKKSAITYLKLRRRPCIINLVYLMEISWQTIAQPALGKEASSIV